MSPMPRDISPELVLVDPELAAFARQHLPEPGCLARQHLATLESDAGALVAVTDRAWNESTSERRRGWGMTLLLTVGAVSLTLNGFWLAQTLGSGATDSARAQNVSTFPSGPAFRVTVPSTYAATTAAVLPSSSSVPRTQATAAQHVTVQAKASREKKHVRSTSHASSKSAALLSRQHSVRHARSRLSVHKAAPPVQNLRWRPVRNAAYYDVVLWRDGERVLDLWPSSPNITLPGTTVTHGSKARLAPGRYLWFVYPGFGAKPAHRYGPIASSGILVIPHRGGK